MTIGDNTDIYRLIGVLEGKCDAIISSLGEHNRKIAKLDKDIEDVLEKIERSIKEHEKRISDLEKKQYTILAVATLGWGLILLFFRKIF